MGNASSAPCWCVDALSRQHLLVQLSDVVSFALRTIALQADTPMIHEVLRLENEDQARQRCLSKQHNRGAEAA